MSLFKTREWWSCASGGGVEEYDRGSLCVANVDNSPDGSVKIVTGSFEGFLRIFSPKKRESKPEDLLLEQNLGHPILQIEAGRFLSHNTGEIGLAVLHPRKISVYAVRTVSGLGEQGSYSTLERKYEHPLDRTAGNMAYGPFGGVSGKDFLAVQSMDGMLSVFEQDCPAFSRFLPNFLLPGPLCYVPKIDAFVTCNSQMEVECYRYQILASSTTTSAAHHKGDESTGLTATKRLQVEWSLNVGEVVQDIFVARYSRTLSSTQVDIVVLCERSLFCLKESGQIRFQKRFDYPTAACSAYTLGDSTSTGGSAASSTSPSSPSSSHAHSHSHSPSTSTSPSLQSSDGSVSSASLLSQSQSQQGGQVVLQNLIIASHLGSLMVYKDMQLIWASRISTASIPVSIRVAKFSGLPGLIVTLDDRGSLQVSYLGTDPSYSVVNNPVESKDLNYDEMDKELRTLQQAIREAAQSGRTEPNDRVVLRTQEVSMEGSTSPSSNLVAVCFRLYVSYTGMDTLHNVNIAVTSISPAVKVSQDSIVLDSLAGGSTSKTPTVIPLIFQTSPTTIPNERTAIVVAAYITAKGEPRTSRLEITLPLALFCKIVPPIKTSLYKLTIDTTRRGAPLASLFDDLNAIPSSSSSTSTSPTPESTPSTDVDAPNILSLQYHCGPDVTIIGSKSSGKYRVQSSHFEAMWLLLSELISRLQAYWKDKDPKTAPDTPNKDPFRVMFTEDLPFQEYFALIDAHFEGRKQLAALKEDLEKAATQFRAIQKRLLVRYKDRNAVPLQNMDLLLEGTYDQIIKLSARIQEKQKEIKSAASRLSCGTQLMQRLMRYKFNLDDTSYLVLQTYISARVDDNNSMEQGGGGWEETTDASLVQLLRTVLAVSAQDMAVLPALSAQSDTRTLKQHLIMVSERLQAGGKLYKPHVKKKPASDKKEGKATKSSSSRSQQQQQQTQEK